MRYPILLLVISAVVATLLAPAQSGSADSSTRSVVVKVFAPRAPASTTCERVYPLRRTVAPPAVLTGALHALLASPTAAERRHGYGGWFSARTAHSLRSVRVTRDVAYVDLRDLRRVIPNASSSCGSALLLAQLERTLTQFPRVRRAVYSIDGNRRAFYEWLQLEPPSVRR
jgi:hypothetical protein